jgi:hypothetical protein
VPLHNSAIGKEGGVEFGSDLGLGIVPQERDNLLDFHGNLVSISTKMGVQVTKKGCRKRHHRGWIATIFVYF